MRKPRHIAQVLMGMACVVFAVLFFILAGSSIAVSLLFWRCPKCGKKFPLRYGAMDRAECCPFCGEKIC